MDHYVTTLDSLTFYGALTFNTAFFLASLWGVVSFYPSRNVRGNNAAGWLVLAIWIGFLGVGLNVFYWRIVCDLLIRHDLVEIAKLRHIGAFGDVLWKGMGLVSIYLHFYARYQSIPEEERGHWTPLLMGFYPDLDVWARRVIIAINVRLGLKK